MKKNIIAIFISAASFLFGMGAQAHGEMVLVQTKIFTGNLRSLQFTLNDQHYSVCTGGSEYCPNRLFISISPDRDYSFDVYMFEGSGYTISDSCRGVMIRVKKNTGRTITIVSNKKNITCS